MTQEYINNLLRISIMEEVNKRMGKDFENVNDLIDYAKSLEKENEQLKQQNEKMKCCDNCKHFNKVRCCRNDDKCIWELAE